MLFKQNQDTIKLGELVIEEAALDIDRTSAGIQYVDSLHKRNEDLAKTTIYGSESREDCDVLSPVTRAPLR